MNSNKRDIYFEGKIYKDADMTDWEFAKAIGNPSIYIALGGLTSYPVKGFHSFKDGEDVTGRYELKHEYLVGDTWMPVVPMMYDAMNEPKRIVALPTPAPVAEQEFQYKGWNFIEQKWEEVTKEVYDTLLDPARCAIPVAELPKEAEGKEFMTDKMKIRNLEREVEWLKDRVSYIENKLKIDG